MNLKRQSISLMMAMFFVLLIILPIHAAIADDTDLFEYEIKNGKVTIIMCDMAASGSVTVPDTIQGYPVTEISLIGFMDCVNVTEINIGKNVVKIGEWAFLNCPNLEAINIDPQNTAFASLEGVLLNKQLKELIKCPAAKQGSFTIPDTVLSMLTSSFYDCRKLTEIIIGAGLKSIPSSAFANCSRLESITLTSNIASIADLAFGYCTSLKEIVIPNSVTSIGASAFYACIALEKAVIGSAVQSIGSMAFGRCESLVEFEVAPNNAYYRADQGILYAKDGKTIVCYPVGRETDGGVYKIPNGIANIGASAFFGWQKIERLLVPQGILAVGDAAFKDCNNLRAACFYGQAPNIGQRIFDNMAEGFAIYCFNEYAAGFLQAPFKGYTVVSVTPGDPSGDGKTDSLDIAATQQHLLYLKFLDGAGAFAADMDMNGALDSRDIALLQKKLLGL